MTTGKEKGKRKLALRWEGSYIIGEEVHLGPYILVKEDETKIKNI